MDVTGTATGYERDDLTTWFATYALALQARELDDIDERHDFPGLLVGPGGSTVLHAPEDVLDATAPRAERSLPPGLVAVVPVLGRVDEVGDALLWAQVRWSYRDENDDEMASRKAVYVLRRGYGTFLVCVIAPEA